MDKAKYQTALITGVSGEIGFALASYLVKNIKIKSLFVTARSCNKDFDLKTLCDEYNVTLHIEHFDIRDDETLNIFIKKALNDSGQTIVIANAGVSLAKDDDSFLENLFEINRAFDINTKASIKTLYFALQAFLDKTNLNKDTPLSKDSYNLLDRKDKLTLVAISSLASTLALRSSPLYSASKVAINYYVNALRESLPEDIKDKVQISLVLPGFVKSNMSDRYIGSKVSIISATKAANIIINGCLKGKKTIVFPFYLYVLIHIGKLLPSFILKIFLKGFDFKVIADKDSRTNQDKKGDK